MCMPMAPLKRMKYRRGAPRKRVPLGVESILRLTPERISNFQSTASVEENYITA